jgi:glycosyltransferase involved in cell wall biosynthesis
MGAVKVLLVTFYFPPAGGAGVPRLLKLAEHLPELGIETHVLAPDDPKWLHVDEALQPPPAAIVHRAKNLGPRSRRPAEELAAARGLARLRLRAQLLFRGLLVPDASVVWTMTAAPAAARLVRKHGIDVVVTTSPPGSVHLVGSFARRFTRARWVADLRDSIASHPHRRRQVRGEAALARHVARRADAVVAASDAIAAEMQTLEPPRRLQVIVNGCDFEDFEGLEYRPGERLRVTHAGNFFGQRNPRAFLQALARTDEGVVARFVGGFPAVYREYVEGLGLGDRVEVVPHRSRAEVLALQRDSDALLLLIPDNDGRGRGVLSGKIFEYIAAERPILAVVPPDGEAAALIRATGSGTVVAPDDVEGIRAALGDLEARWRAGELAATPLSPEWRKRLSRRARAEEFAAVLGEVAGKESS